MAVEIAHQDAQLVIEALIEDVKRFQAEFRREAKENDALRAQVIARDNRICNLENEIKDWVERFNNLGR